MPPNRLRFLWPALCALLLLALIGSTVHWQKQLRIARQKPKKPPRQPAFDKRDAAYFQALAALRGYQLKPPLLGADAARLAAYDRMEVNKQWAIARNAEPTTFSTRDPEFTQRTTLPLAPTMQFELAQPFEHYRYELVNKSDRTLPAPILFQDDRWDSATEMVARAGFKSIADEAERAVAIWRFVCPRRVYGEPPTEGAEEHDATKFFACYGYGFCDDSARALATLAELSGLKSRVWELGGHVVAEVMANGHWRMLDADQQAYFHRAGAPLDILGVEELAADRAGFTHIVSFRDVNEYPPKYIASFLSPQDNKISGGGSAAHRLEPVLRAGERMTFTNYNWGRYFLGKYPTPPPRFYNGTFTYAFRARDLTGAAGQLTSEPIENGWRLRNDTDKVVSVELPFSYPFPIVGGLIAGTATVAQGAAQLRLEDADHRRTQLLELRDRIRIDLDHFVAILTSDPTYHYSISFTLGPGTVLELRDFKVLSDFQFARLALLPLAVGANEFHAHFPDKSDPAAFEFSVAWK